MRDFHKGVWQMSLAMLISGSIGAFVLLSGLPVTEVVFWRCLIGAMALFIFIRVSQKPFRHLTRTTLLLAYSRRRGARGELAAALRGL